MARTKYMIWDLETENHETYRRFCNPFDPKNYVVLRGWKVQGDSTCSWEYCTEPGTRTIIPKTVKVLVGHNIKFDLLFEWENIKEFLRDGGVIWDTQYMEYLLQGQTQEFRMNSLDQLAVLYGGTTKLDSVKALWEAGYLTSEIDKDLLIDYLVGTAEEGRNSGDIGNTEKIFLGQFAKVTNLGVLKAYMARMEGLLCTTEMEYNGLHVDTQEGERVREELLQELTDINTRLSTVVELLPRELNFNWGSQTHVSCLLFGGTIRYSSRKQILKDGIPQFKTETIRKPTGKMYLSGKRKGEPVFTNVTVTTDEPKTRLEDEFYTFPQIVKPNPKHLLERTDAKGGPTYSISGDSVDELRKYNIPFLKDFIRRVDIVKDMGVYYWVQDAAGKRTGMLTCVMPDGKIHHKLNHTSTVTTRLSSTEPNLQNVPREDTSEVKRMFVSRFPDGEMLELDYMQLEIVGQAWLSGDEHLTQDVINAIDMHCKRVSAKFGIPYEDAVYLCKNEDAPEHHLWKTIRTGAKSFSFQRAFGAGANTISEKTGMSVQDIEDMIRTEELMYPGVVKYNTLVADEVARNAVPFRDPNAGYRVFRSSWYRAPTGTKYTFRSYDAPEYLKKRGIMDSFKPTEQKNYPVQGTSGEFVQCVLGKLFRHFLMNRNYNGQALLVNTVHDCVWADSMVSIRDQVAKDMKRIMEGIPRYIKEVYDLPCRVPFRVEVEAGKSLYDKRKLHLEDT